MLNMEKEAGLIVVRYAIRATPFGRLLVAASARGLCAVALGSDDAELVHELAAERPDAMAADDDDDLAGWADAVLACLDGASAAELPLDVPATPFQAAVWRALQAIPYGETRSYAAIAAAIGQPGEARAVGAACASNRLALVVPCHRVVRSDGRPGGYRWGLARKQRLLAHERRGRVDAGDGAAGDGAAQLELVTTASARPELTPERPEVPAQPPSPPELVREVEARVAGLDWDGIAASLDAHGFAPLPALVSPAECAALSALYGDGDRFRSRIVMERFRFGRGEYQYFAYPLPPLVAELRRALYARLAPLANRWAELLDDERRFPDEHAAFVAECAAAGQTRPTPLLLRYGAGDYNRLHQDLYGDVAFPLQVTAFLSQPGRDYEGGAFVLLEQRARMQSAAEALLPRQGDALVFATRFRPLGGATRARAALKHGVSRVTAGHRDTLGLIFHDAR